MEDYDDPEIEDAWRDARRNDVAEYLRVQGVRHGEIGDWPAWHVAPMISVWAIESVETRGAVGWWVIAGDLPTDYISGVEAGDPRAAVRAFADRWRVAAEQMRAGGEAPGVSIGRTEQERRSLAPILASRASLLRRWSEDDEIWADLFDEG